MNTYFKNIPADKVLAYATAYLEMKIEEHESFMKNFKGDASKLAQFSLVERYKQELNTLQALLEAE
ncbi:hypothetical protein ACPA0F_18500 [Solibacillus silvestris]